MAQAPCKTTSTVYEKKTIMEPKVSAQNVRAGHYFVHINISVLFETGKRPLSVSRLETKC